MNYIDYLYITTLSIQSFPKGDYNKRYNNGNEYIRDHDKSNTITLISILFLSKLMGILFIIEYLFNLTHCVYFDMNQDLLKFIVLLVFPIFCSFIFGLICEKRYYKKKTYQQMYDDKKKYSKKKRYFYNIGIIFDHLLSYVLCVYFASLSY